MVNEEPKRDKVVPFPASLLDRVTSLSQANRRSANAEIVVAVERHVTAEEAEPRRSKR